MQHLLLMSIALRNPKDIRADENGVWKRMGSPVAYISIHRGNAVDESRIFWWSKIGSLSQHFKISRFYYQHSTSPDFHRVISTVYGEYYSFTHGHTLLPRKLLYLCSLSVCGKYYIVYVLYLSDSNCQQRRMAFVQYSFDRQEHPIDLKPHGNSKDQKPFTQQSLAPLPVADIVVSVISYLLIFTGPLHIIMTFTILSLLLLESSVTVHVRDMVSPTLRVSLALVVMTVVTE